MRIDFDPYEFTVSTAVDDYKYIIGTFSDDIREEILDIIMSFFSLDQPSFILIICFIVLITLLLKIQSITKSLLFNHVGSFLSQSYGGLYNKGKKC